jgi:putative nucleotidyltransferase with HDIG domain
MDKHLAKDIFKNNIGDELVAKRVLEHTKLVKKISFDVARKIIKAKVYREKINLDTLALCAILHDIGREKNPPGTPHSLRHNISGQNIIKTEIKNRLIMLKNTVDKNKKKNLEEDISALEICAKVCKTHICVGFTEKEVKKYKLDLPLDDYTPKSIYEKIVCYADKLADGKKKCDISYSVNRFGNWLGEDYKKKVLLLDKNMKKIMSC